jgi:hypothetical protein
VQRRASARARAETPFAERTVKRPDADTPACTQLALRVGARRACPVAGACLTFLCCEPPGKPAVEVGCPLEAPDRTFLWCPRSSAGRNEAMHERVRADDRVHVARPQVQMLPVAMEREATALLAKLLADAARDRETVPCPTGEQREESSSHDAD